MSTYLVALIVSDFSCIKSTAKPSSARSVDVSVCARPNAIDQLGYALKEAIRLIEFFENYYNVPYPLPKCG
jgi:aminopeptidase N